MSIDCEPSIVIQLLPSDLKKRVTEKLRSEEGEMPNDRRNDQGIISKIS